MNKKVSELVDDTRGLVSTVSFVVHTRGGDDGDVADLLRHFADRYDSRAGRHKLSPLDELVAPNQRKDGDS